MKPVRLTLQAFGPYPDRQVVDFRDAVEAGLFGIYGQTGSGKSTLFSAMTFALFGQPAKTDQEAVSLRSDHAAADLLTEVELVFEVGGRRYVVLRRPDQMRPRQRGTGETKNPHEAFLFDATGLALEEITADRRGKVIAEKKVGPVDAAIVERLGYGPEQFRQIVLLPQGRFETFLSAKTKDRVEILRDLFDVSLYRRLAETLKEQADAAERQVQRERAVYDQRLAAEGFDGDEALTAGIVAAEEHLAIRQQALTEAKAAAQAAQGALQAATQTEERFLAAERATQALTALQVRTDEMEARARRLEQAERAQVLTDAEAAARTAAAERTEAAAAVLRARSAAAAAAEQAQRAEERLAAELAREPEGIRLRQRTEDLTRHRGTLEQAAGVLTALATTRAAAETGRVRLAAAQTALERQRAEQSRAAERLKQARLNEARRQDLSVQGQALRQVLKLAMDHAAARQAVAAAEQAVTERQGRRDQAAAAVTGARQALEQAEQAVLHSKAVSLARQLHPGQPCPVCGGQDHPAPAGGEAGSGDLTAARQAAETRWQAADQAGRRAEESLTAARSVLAERQARLATLDCPETAPEILHAQMTALEADLAVLGPVTDLKAAETALERLGSAISAADADRDRLRETLAEHEVAVAALVAQRDVLLDSVPQDVRDPATLTAELTAAHARLEALLRTRQQAEEAVRLAGVADLGAAKDVQAALQTEADRVRRAEEASAFFHRRLEQTGLTPDAYQALKPQFPRLAEERAAVEAFRRDLAGAEEAVRQTGAAVEGLTRPALADLTAQRDAADAVVLAMQEQEVAARQRRMALLGLQDSLAEAKRAVEAVEAASAPLRGLAAAVTGKNPQNLSLEIYAIAAMFDAVLQAANLRLGPMTAYRYQLIRDAEGSGRAQRGLGIQVFDAHTGKERPTATLSGGETFIAALALALGLADVVESTSGRVQLDTIFIDEGFGSLDTEHGTGTLDQVLQVLNALVSQNRAVGLISHVPLVQEAIPNGFYIRKQAGGSRVETRGRRIG